MRQEGAEELFDLGTSIRTKTNVAGGDAPRVMLAYAWAERLELHDLVVKVAADCRKFKVDKLIIENKASGHSVAQELRRLFGHEDWGVQMLDPKAQDKLSRLYSVQHIWSEGMIYAPDKAWAEQVIAEVSVFPKGKHDDLTDTCSMAIRHLRELGLLTRAPEWSAEIRSQTQHTSPVQPIYPV